jgi:mediator of replication checkpoint protein 1
MQSPTASPRAPTSPASAPTSPNSHTSSSELTPRSKVRALLQLDDDSDFDSPLKPLSVSKSRKSASPRSVRKSPSDQFTKSKSDASDDSNSESDAAPRKPVGRIVARLHGHNAMNKQTQSTKPSTHESTVESEEDDDEDIPVSKQLKQRKRPSASALSTPSKSASDSIGSAASSPGLFVSPGPANVSMSDDDRLPVVNLASKLRALAQNSEQAEKPPQQSAKSKKSKSKKARHSPLNSDEIDKLATSENEDADVEDRLTQQTRTSRRKASKKALEEMNRETQRMARNQQLAHQAKVRRKFTKADLFKKFNFNPETGTIAETSSPEKPSQRVAADKSSEDELYMMSGALVSSDVETSKRKDTPPTSPVHIGNTPKKSMVEIQPADEAEIPSKDKSTTALATKNPRVTRQFRVILPQTTHVMLDDSDDELEIVKPNKALALLDHLPVNKNGEDSSLLRLRHLANLTSPGKKRKNGSSMNAAELQAQLRGKARQQAINEKEERIADLRAKGIHVQTYEEREKEQLELENLLEKARVDAVDIAKKEKAAAKKAGVDVDAHDILDDDEDDDDWDGEDEAEQSDAELALSGSEDEEDGEVDDDEGEGVNNMPLFDNEADESDGDDIGENIEEVFSIFKKKPSTANDKLSENSVTSDINQIAGQFHQAVTGAHTAVEETVQSDSDSGPVKAAPRHSRKRMVVEDDDDEDNDLEKPTSTASQRSAGDETRVAFGFKSQAPAFGLSQLLDSTLAGADSQDLSQVFDPEEDSLALLRDLPDGTAPQFSTPSFRHGLVPDSQRVEVDKATLAPFTQINLGISQFPDFPSTDADMSPTKMSEMIEPTQDAGFAVPRMPIGGLGGPSSTVDTVMIDAQQETPVAKTKGRLVRKTEAIAELSEEETDDEYSDGAQEVDHGKDVFNVLFNGAKKSAAKAEFNKKKSAAKELVEDQAEESEDEYAGLGGASDDESNGEVDEEMLKMMDDGHVDVNERAVIALHA